MEEQKKSTRNRKLIAALCSLVLCMLLIGVSVYAALSQSATITNTISITRSGQSYVSITVEKTSNTGATAYTATTGDAVGTTYSELLTVAAGQSGTTTDETKMTFSQSVGKNAYAYKIYLKNESADTAVKYSIKMFQTGTTNPYTSPSAQIVIGKATGDGNVEAYADMTDCNLAANAEATVYIVVYANVALENLEPTDGTTFDLAINTTAVSA